MSDIGPRLEARVFISGFRAPWNVPVENLKLVTTFRLSTPGSAWSMAKDSLYRIRPVIPLGIGNSGCDIRKMRHIANLKSVHVKVNQLPSGDVHALGTVDAPPSGGSWGEPALVGPADASNSLT